MVNFKRTLVIPRTCHCCVSTYHVHSLLPLLESISTASVLQTLPLTQTIIRRQDLRNEQSPMYSSGILTCPFVHNGIIHLHNGNCQRPRRGACGVVPCLVPCSWIYTTFSCRTSVCLWRRTTANISCLDPSDQSNGRIIWILIHDLFPFWINIYMKKQCQWEKKCLEHVPTTLCLPMQC